MLVAEDAVSGYIDWLIEQGALRVAYHEGEKVFYPDMDRMKKVAPEAHDIFYGSLLEDVGRLVEEGSMNVEYDDKSNDFVFTVSDVEEESLA